LIFIEAIKQDGLTLEYVKEQTSEIFMAAVQQNGWKLKYLNVFISQTIKWSSFVKPKKEKLIFRFLWKRNASAQSCFINLSTVI